MFKVNKFIKLILIILIVSFYGIDANALSLPENNKYGNITSITYFTGIGCPHCAKVDPVLFKKPARNNDLLVIEYEIYQQRQNAPLLMKYNDMYKSGLGVPLAIFDGINIDSLVGDRAILSELGQGLQNNKSNKIVLSEKSVTLDELNFSEIPGTPKIWYKDRVAVKTNTSNNQNKLIKEFILDGLIPEKHIKSNKKHVDISGGKIIFKKAIEIDGWILMYN